MSEKEYTYTGEQLAFIGFMIEQNFKNAGDAYLRAYQNCKPSASGANASKLLRSPKIKAKISQELEKALEGKKAHLEHELFNFWYVRMSYDPSEIINLDGTLKINVEELRRRGLQVCIDSINRKLNAKGDPYVEYKLADRDKAADQLAKYIAMIKPQPIMNLNFNRDAEHMSAEEERLYQEQLKSIRGVGE